jgi:hypothetical protein
MNTRNMLRRRNKFLEEGYNCVLCQNSMEETIEHLFFDCPTTTSRWFVLGIIWEENVNIHEKIYIAKYGFMHPFFKEIFMIGAWVNERAPNLTSWKSAFKEELVAHLIRIKQSLHQSIRLWLDDL